MTIDILVGSLVLVGQSVGVGFGTPPTGSVAFTGHAPVPGIISNGPLPVGTLTLTGQSVGIGFGTPPTGDVRVTGYAPSITASGAGSIPSGSLAFSGQYVAVAFTAPDTGVLALTGRDIQVVVGSATDVTRVTPTGTLRITGAVPTSLAGVIVDVPKGAVVHTGYAPTIAASALDIAIVTPTGRLYYTGRVLTPAYAGGILAQSNGRLHITGYAPTVAITGAGATNYTLTIEGEFSPGFWTPFGSDLILVDGVRWMRGTTGTGPLDTVASTGTCQFTLRNDARCSGGRGYYSPNHTNCRSGFAFGLPVRVSYTYLGVTTIRWTGKLRMIDPTSGQYGQQVTRCIANDVMGELAEFDVREVTVQINQTEDTLLNAIIDTLPAEAQPLARDFDTGLSAFPVAFDDVGTGTPGLSAVERVVTSARGRLFVLGDGTLRYLNPDTVSLTLPAYTFADTEAVITVPSDLSSVYNRVRLTGHPKSFSPAPVVLGAYDGTLALAPGETVEQWLDYSDVDNPDTAIGGHDFVDPPVATTDYLWNSAADGTGTDVTADVSVVASYFVSTVKLTVTNNGVVTAHKQLLQVRGIAIYDYGPVTIESYVARPYGNRPIDIDLPYQDDLAVLQEQSAFINVTYRDLTDQVKDITFYPQTSAALMAQAMSLELGDVVFVSDPQTLPGGAHTFIQAIEIETNQDGILTCRLSTAPWVVSPVLFDSTVGVADTLTSVDAAPESRIGFAMIGYSEIG